MRITNHMIMNNASVNINGTKISVNDINTQMTTQQKISRPSDDPVVAIRSLRFSTTLSKIDQYYEKNIPDAESWLDVTESALINMKSLITDFRTECVNGSTGTLTQDDRNTILKQLQSLQDQIYMEGNADYAQRTVFTGFRTNQNLVFTENETSTSYQIKETFKASDDINEYRYYTGDVLVPNTQAEVLGNAISDTEQTNYYRIRTAYSGLDSLDTFSYSYGNPVVNEDFTGIDSIAMTDVTDPVTGQVVGQTGTATGSNGTTMVVYDNESAWAADAGSKVVDDDQIVVIKDSGQIVFGKNIASTLKQNNADINLDYTKTGFDKGQLKPEYYFDCKYLVDKDGVNQVDRDGNPGITYKKFNDDGTEIGYDIDYTISANQTLTVNLEACDAIDNNIQRDMEEMINAVQRSINAHDKVEQLKKMKNETQYATDEYQEKLDSWIKYAQKEADYYDDNMQKLFSTELGKSDVYLEDISLSITKVGCTVDQLKLTQTRMQDQQETVRELQSKNDDLDLSKIIIDYTAAYTAYQASLTAASKLGSMTLLNYLS